MIEEANKRLLEVTTDLRAVIRSKRNRDDKKAEGKRISINNKQIPFPNDIYLKVEFIHKYFAFDLLQMKMKRTDWRNLRKNGNKNKS